MDKIEKLLRKLSAKEQEAMLLLMQQIKHDFRKIPGIEALRGLKGWFRVRVGHYRIIFMVHPATKDPTSPHNTGLRGARVEIRRITRRNEATYKHLE